MLKENPSHFSLVPAEYQGRMRPELIGLSGGRKKLWLNNHKEEILEYYKEHGKDATMTEYCLKQDTFENFLRNSLMPNSNRKQPDINNLLHRLQFLEESFRDIKRRQNRLEDSYNDFVPSVAETMAGKFFIPGLIKGLLHTFKGKDTPPLQDKLSMTDLKNDKNNEANLT